MRLTCPSCAATYDVPEALRPARRRIRCSACGMEWVAEPDAPAEAAPVAAAVVAAPEPPPRPAPAVPPRILLPPPPPPRRRSGLIAAWIASLVLLAVLAGAAWVERAAVIKAWPPSARVYAALGGIPAK